MNPPALFCENPTCPSRGMVGESNIIQYGRKKERQRYRCTSCGQTFMETKGTPFYRRRTPRELLCICVTLLAYGCPPQAIVAAFHLDERTVYAWLLAAGEHCRRVHEQRVIGQPRSLWHVQADEVRVRLQRRLILWMAMAIQVPTRLWLGGVVSARRDKRLIQALVEQVKACALWGPLLLVADGLSAYVSAWRNAFRTPVHTGRRGRPRLLGWPLLIGQVIKQKENGRVVGVLQKLVEGSWEEARNLLSTPLLNTAYIERLNATFRSRLTALVRRGRSLARQTQTLEAGMFLVGTVYNFCAPHKSLREEEADGQRRWRLRTPAMAAGITAYRWSVEQLLRYRVPPPPTPPPRRPGRLPRRLREPVQRLSHA